MADNIGIHWFRLDLRLNDNPSIENLSKNVNSIMPIYIYDESQNIGKASKCWLEKSLRSLNAQLNNFNSKLYIFRGDPKKVISKILQNKSISHVYWNRLYDEESINRDKNIKSFLLKKTISCQSFNGYLLTEPWNIQNKSGSFFKVFTPFWKTNNELLKNTKLKLSPNKKYNFHNLNINFSLNIEELNLNNPKKTWMEKILSN